MIEGHYFVSYSRLDAQDFAVELADRLQAEEPGYRLWVDVRDIRPGQDWDEQIAEAIQSCIGVLFVVTPDSVRDTSGCRQEVAWALRYKKPVVPLRLHPDAELPFRLASRQYVDFVDRNAGMARLRLFLAETTSPAGALRELKYRLTDAEREFPRAADDAQRGRIERDMTELRRRITEQETLLQDPRAAQERTERRIAAGVEAERRASRPQPDRPAKVRWVNPAPMTVPGHFQDRHTETELIGEFLRSANQRLMTVVGRGGVGKTAMVCRLLKELEGGHLPDELGEMTVDGIVYLSPGAHPISFPNLFADLCRLLPDDTADRMLQSYRDPQSAGQVMRSLLEQFPTGRYVVLLDSFEELVDTSSDAFKVTDPAVDDALRTVLTGSQHGLKVIITTRVAPRELMLVRPAAQTRLNLDEGLSSPFAEHLLRARDPDGNLGLRDAPDELLNLARERTRGFPRALEALAAILAADRTTTLPALLDETGPLPENVAEALVGAAYNRLDPLAQQVIQALAIYNLQVPAVAVDFLLQPHCITVDSAVLLDRLADMRYVSRDGNHYYLHPVDRDYALSRVPLGKPTDHFGDEREFTRHALWRRATQYFEQVRKAPNDANELEDLVPQFGEIELRCLSGDYDGAARVLFSIEDRLLSWGHLSVVAELHERLQGRLRDPRLRQASLSSLRHTHLPLRPTEGEHQDYAALQLQQTLRGHQSPITRLAWLPDGWRLLSAALDQTLRLWDSLDGRELKVFRGHTDQVLALAVMPDGARAISASADRTLRLWDLNSGTVLQVFTGHLDSVTAVAVSPDGRTAVSGSWDRTLKIWDVNTGTEQRTLSGHDDRINDVAVTPDGRRAISAAWDQTLRLWDIETGREENVYRSKSGGENSIVLLDGGKVVAAGSEDATIRVWRLSDSRQLTNLQGATSYVTGVSVSADGRLLAAKSADHTVRFWRTDSWMSVGTIDERSPIQSIFAGIAFSQESNLFATLGEQDTIIRIWEIDVDRLLSHIDPGQAVHYTTAKVVLVGDQGVGKTGLGLRLARGEYQATDSTHGQHFWVVNSLHGIRVDATDCDVILWDFAGQTDYRLVHSLFLEDVDLALLLFDPAREEPFEAAQFWLNQLRIHGRSTPIVLVAGRIDVGAPRLSAGEIQRWCDEIGVSGGYVATSAKTNEGVNDLKALISRQLGWLDKSSTVSPLVFTKIKEVVLQLREKILADNSNDEFPLLLTPERLSELLIDDRIAGAVFNFDEMMTAVGHLANHGLISLLHTSSGSRVILLVPDMLNNLAASVVLEARRNRFGMLDEARLARGDYPFQELELFCNEHRAILLDAAIVLFLRNNLCFRATIGGVVGLVFPSLISEERPARSAVPTVEDMSYFVTGRVATVYASIVVQLGHTGTFTRTNQWKNQAQYEMGTGQICGFRQVETHEGATEFVLYYAETASDDTRTLFRLLFERNLQNQDLSVSKYRPVVCPRCQYRQDRNAVMRRSREGKTGIGCANACGAIIEFSGLLDESTPSAVVQQQANEEQLRAQMRTAFEVALVQLRRMLHDSATDRKPPSCFISYAWGLPEDERWVLQLATDLRNAGVQVLLDQWDNAEPGQSIARFITRIKDCDFVIAIGTPLYRQKASNEVSEEGSISAAEVDLINRLMIGTEAHKRRVLPILRSAGPGHSFPDLLVGRTYADFRIDERYFIELMDVILTLYRHSLADVRVVRATFKEDLSRSGLLNIATK